MSFVLRTVTASNLLIRNTWKTLSRSYHSVAMTSTFIKNRHNDITKSARDQRMYRGLELTNGMKLLLISDSTTDKSSAAMDVHIGHLSDPRDLPGLAHFCEHMLFLGTEKYPVENEYSKFLSEHGGSSNAFTSGEHTNFYFDITPQYLPEALDRFSQFFRCPLFTASATEREVNAVNSENDKNLASDMWRLHQLERATCDPAHDFSKFGTGNKDTLLTKPREKGVDVRDELLKFHNKHYSSNMMGLAILGKESLDELTELVVPLFHDVVNKNVEVPKWLQHPAEPDFLKLEAHVVPVKDIRSLNVTWPIPDLHEFYKSSPGHYLGHLIGHEGQGSLLSELKLRGWVNTLVGGEKLGANGFGFFIVNVDLTEVGIEHTEDIVELIFQYLNLLRAKGPQEWVFNECKDLNAMHFRFKDKERPRSYTCGLAASLHDYPLPEVLSASYMMDEYRPDLISSVLNKLTPDNVRVAVIGKKFEGQTDKEEQWYGTQYTIKPISEEVLKKWNSAGFHDNLVLPTKNEFIPTNFDLFPLEDESAGGTPQIIENGDMSCLWFKQDDKFFMPKCCVSIDVISPYAYMDPLSTSLNYMFVTLFKDSLTEYAYDAELAGLHYSLNSSIYGLTLNFRGYNDKQHVLLQKVMDRMVTFKVDPKRFDIWKENYIRGLKNFQTEQPHQHAIYYTNLLMSEQCWGKDELLEVTDDLTVERLENFIPQLLSRLFLEFLVYGNVTAQKARELVAIVEKNLQGVAGSRPLPVSQRRRFREVQLPDGCYYLYKRSNQVHKSSSLEVYYQCNVQETTTNMLLELFVQIISEPCFDILRTQEQLGYIVFSGIRRASGVQGLRVIVQSDKSPEFVESRIEAFLVKMGEHLEEMAAEVYDKHVQALSTKRLELPKKLSAQNGKYWGEIVSQQYNFDRDNIEVKELKSLTREDVLAFYKEVIAPSAPKRHKLCVHVVSSANHVPQQQEVEEAGQEAGEHKEEPAVFKKQAQEVTDVHSFKSQLGLFPLAKPYITVSSAAKSKL